MYSFCTYLKQIHEYVLEVFVHTNTYLNHEFIFAVWGVSLKKVSYKASVFPVFSRNQEKTKPLT